MEKLSRLQLAARCALADLVHIYNDGLLDEASQQSALDLYYTLKEEKVDVSDYAESISDIAFEVDETNTGRNDAGGV